MKKLIVLLALLVVPSAHAENAWLNLNGSPSLISKSGFPLRLGSQGTDGVEIVAGSATPIVIDGAGVRLSEVVITPATDLTPTSANEVKALSVVATAAPTSASVSLPASPSNGERKRLYNAGANPVVVAALGTPGMNGSASNRRTVLAAKSWLDCQYSLSLNQWSCSATAAVPTPIA